MKNFILGLILASWTQIWAANFFKKNLALSVTRYHDQLSSCIISEKTTDPIWRKLIDRQKDGLMDGKTDRKMDRPMRVVS